MKILDEIIEECIEANALFTTYDIIPEARERGCTLSNESISQYIKNYRYPIFYTRTIKELGCEITAPIYHPSDVDANDYDASDILPESKEIKQDITVSELMSQSAERMIQEKKSLGLYRSTISNKKSELFDKRGRYHVKVADVQKAGFDIGEQVNIFVDNDNGNIILTNKSRKPKDTKQVGKVKVDMYQNVSVAKTPFKMINNTEKPSSLSVKASKGLIKIIPSY